MSLAIERQAGALGAYIHGIDLRAPLDDVSFEKLHAAFLEHHVICIRDQDMPPARQLEYARRWGRVFVHPYVDSIEGHPGIMELGDPHPITTTWHSDVTHSKTPPRMSMLLARTIPPYGGDTMFANQHLAWEQLSPGLRCVLQGLRAVHRGTELSAGHGLKPREVTALHPVARRHPETDRLGLYVNGDYTTHFEGWTEAESRPLLQFLFDQGSRPEYTWRHHWRVGDLLMWDNASVQHAVVGDVAKGERLLHRITIEGDAPF